jgi:hypothetical protein
VLYGVVELRFWLENWLKLVEFNVDDGLPRLPHGESTGMGLAYLHVNPTFARRCGTIVFVSFFFWCRGNGRRTLN